jgi:stage II sporulation protein D
MSRALGLTAGVFCGFLAAGLASATPTAPSSRAARPAPLKPGEPVFVISGHGWGHGVGMGQWGANGFARRGTAYDRILAHYYPGTSLEQAPVAQVRVLLAAGRKTLTISSEAPFRVRDAKGKAHALAAGKLVLGPGLKVKPKAAKRKIALKPPVVFLPGDAPLRLRRPYRGSIRVGLDKGALTAINYVGLEEYLYGVVPAEVPDDWPAEVLKAQAVAARSYALATRKLGGAFDLYPDVRSQVYRGVDEEEDSTNAAVDETAGEVLMYRGNVATTYFHSTSGGRTASITDVWPGSKPVPYLVSVDDPYDSLSPYHDWGPEVFSATRLDRVLKTPGRLLDVRTTVSPSARVTTVAGLGSLGQITLRGSDLRRALKLRSTWFRVGALGLPPPAKPLAYGTTGKLSGTARAVGKTLLELRSGSLWRAVTQVRPQEDGSFSATVRPTASGQYRLTAGTVHTAPVTVGVAPRVTLDPVVELMTMSGSVQPALNGTSVELQRLTGTIWKTVGRTTVDAAGDFQAHMRIPPGSYRARIPAPGRGLVPGTSSTLVVNR